MQSGNLDLKMHKCIFSNYRNELAEQQLLYTMWPLWAHSFEYFIFAFIIYSYLLIRLKNNLQGHQKEDISNS